MFTLGYYLAIYFDKIKKYMKYMFIPSIIIYSILFPYYNVYIDNILVFYVISISAMIIIYNLVIWNKSRKIEKVLSFFGRKSLEIYLCQCVCLNIGIGNGLLKVISIFITATTISAILAKVTNQYYITRAFLYGNIRRKKHE